MSVWPPIIILSLNLISLGIDLATHGETKTERTNFFSSLIAAVAGLAILW